MTRLSYTDEAYLTFTIEVLRYMRVIPDRWDEISRRTTIPAKKCKDIYLRIIGPSGRERRWKDGLQVLRDSGSLDNADGGLHSDAESDTSSIGDDDDPQPMTPPTSVPPSQETTTRSGRTHAKALRSDSNFYSDGEHGYESVNGCTDGHSCEYHRKRRTVDRLQNTNNQPKANDSERMKSSRRLAALPTLGHSRQPENTHFQYGAQVERRRNTTSRSSSCTPHPPKVSDSNAITLGPRQQGERRPASDSNNARPMVLDKGNCLAGRPIVPPRNLTSSQSSGNVNSQNGQHHGWTFDSEASRGNDGRNQDNAATANPTIEHGIHPSRAAKQGSTTIEHGDHINVDIKVSEDIYPELCRDVIRNLNAKREAVIRFDKQTQGGRPHHLLHGVIRGPRAAVASYRGRIERRKKQLLDQRSNKRKGPTVSRDSLGSSIMARTGNNMRSD